MQTKYGLSISFTECEFHVKLELRGILKFLTYFIFLHVPSHLSRYFGGCNHVKLESWFVMNFNSWVFSPRVLYCVVDTGYGVGSSLGDYRPALPKGRKYQTMTNYQKVF